MKYKFLFKNYEKEVEAIHAREIQKGDEVQINDFFPDIEYALDYFTVTNIKWKKGLKEIHMSKKYDKNGVNLKDGDA